MKGLLQQAWQRKGAVFFLAIFTAFCVAFSSLRAYWQQPLEALSEDRLYLVEEGASLGFVVEDLAAHGLWSSARIIRLCLRTFAPQFLLKAGEYRLPDSSSPAEVFAILNSGVSVQYKLTLREGETLQQWWRQLASAEALQPSVHISPESPLPPAGIVVVEVAGGESYLGANSEALSALLSLPAREMMAPQSPWPEGWFFPDTYHYSRGDSVDDILYRAHVRMLQVLQQAWSERADGLPYRSPYEALIMASLIEKETGLARERAEIAAVFVRRLEKKMRLQTDPSVIYALGRDYTGNLRRTDLRLESPYNTYRLRGLPPTPIAMPGRESIIAALHPAAGDALYFVAKGDGSHHFSATLAEHRRAVRRYQIAARRSDYRSRP